MAHAPGNKTTHEIPQIMKIYRSGGTPWAVIINGRGRVIYIDFHIEPDRAITLIEWTLANDK